MKGPRPPRPGVSRRLSGRQERGATTDPSVKPSSILSQFLDKLAEAADVLGGHAPASLEHTDELPFSLGGRQGRAVFGYTVRMGLDGLHAERFGDATTTRDDPKDGRTASSAPVARSPIVDVYDGGGDIRVVAELPGASADDVLCAINGQVLHIETRATPCYRKSIQLPAEMDEESLSYSICNGILEVHLRRRATS